MISKSRFPITSFWRSRLNTLLGSFCWMPHRYLKFDMSNSEILSPWPAYYLSMSYIVQGQYSVLNTPRWLLIILKLKSKTFKLPARPRIIWPLSTCPLSPKPPSPFYASALSIIGLLSLPSKCPVLQPPGLEHVLLLPPCLSASFPSIV